MAKYTPPRQSRLSILVAVIDKRAEAFARLGSGFSGTTILGIGFDRDRLIEAGIERAEALLRIAQEGLTNAARHANAQRVWIDLQNIGGEVTLRIEDDGRGADPILPGVGLTGMSERLAKLEGSLSMDRSPHGGLRLTARLPYSAATS